MNHIKAALIWLLLATGLAAQSDEDLRTYEDLQSAHDIAFEDMRFETAYRLSEEILGLSRRIFGETDLRTGSALVDLAHYNVAFGDLEMAKRNYQAALEIEENRTNGAGQRVARIQFKLGEVLARLGEFEAAEQHLRLSVASTAEIFGRADQLSAERAFALATFLQNRFRLKEAEPVFRDAIDVSRVIYPAEDQTLSARLLGFARFLAMAGQKEEAERIYLEVLDIAERTVGVNSDTFLAQIVEIADFYRLSGQFETAKPYYLHRIGAGARAGNIGKTEIDVRINYAGYLAARGEAEAAFALLDNTLRMMDDIDNGQVRFTTERAMIANIMRGVSGVGSEN